MERRQKQGFRGIPEALHEEVRPSGRRLPPFRVLHDPRHLLLSRGLRRAGHGGAREGHPHPRGQPSPRERGQSCYRVRDDERHRSAESYLDGYADAQDSQVFGRTGSEAERDRGQEAMNILGVAGGRAVWRGGLRKTKLTSGGRCWSAACSCQPLSLSLCSLLAVPCVFT